jgi:hypothetical protein
MLCCTGLMLVIALISPLSLSGEPKKKEEAELLPPPRPSAPVAIYVMPNLPQPGTREVWQYYGVDGRGRFLPRVMYAPSGSFYLGTGEPYPWTTTRPTLHMPYVLD